MKKATEDLISKDWQTPNRVLTTREKPNRMGEGEKGVTPNNKKLGKRSKTQ